MKNKGKIIVITIFILVLISSIVITEIMAAISREIENIEITRYKNEVLVGEDEKLVLLTKNKCAKCDDMYKVLKEIKANTKMSVYSINIDELSNSDKNELLSSSALIKYDNLPAVIHISAGIVIGNYTGAAKYDDITAFTEVFKEITVKQYIELVKDDVEHFIYIGRPTCGYCVQSLPWTKRISYQMGKEIYYINIDNETNSDLQLLAESTKNIYKGSTPLFLIAKSGEIVNYKEGAGSYVDLNSFFSEKSTQ